MGSPSPQTDAVVTFAGGCFWCTESNFEKIDGVGDVVSGYMGGGMKNPTYEAVSGGGSGHLEVVQVNYDSSKVSYRELLQAFWAMIDPTDDGGSFYDRGDQYGSAIFFHSEEQEREAMSSKTAIERSKRFDQPIATVIRKAEDFYPAEEYHQDYYKKNEAHYQRYRIGSGRDRYCARAWGRAPFAEDQAWKPLTEGEIAAKLTDLQKHVTQGDGTERAFQNTYWNHKKQGIYVDLISGEPLFASLDKFDSGTGWPSFTRPLDAYHILEKVDTSHGMRRVEVRSRFGDAHLGHLFDDGPEPTRLRYCINSAALRFVGVEELEKEGYGAYSTLFE